MAKAQKAEDNCTYALEKLAIFQDDTNGVVRVGERLQQTQQDVTSLQDRIVYLEQRLLDTKRQGGGSGGPSDHSGPSGLSFSTAATAKAKLVNKRCVQQPCAPSVITLASLLRFQGTLRRSVRLTASFTSGPAL